MAELYAKFTSLEGGMNSGFDPAVISDKQYWMGINVVCRKGRPSTRPDFARCKITFMADRVPKEGTVLPEGVITCTAAQNEAIYKYGKFQGSKEYQTGSARYLVAMVSGWIFIYDVSSGKMYRMSTVPRMARHINRAWFCQVVEYMVVQDGINRPVIINNLSARVSDKTKNEIPAGRAMIFGHGRIFLQISARNFIAGDIYKFYEPEAVFKFTENTYTAEGGAFSVASEIGDITGMHFATQFDTATGDGPLLVACENGVASYAIQNSRTLWNNNDLSKVQVIGTGFVGQSAKTDVNQDMMFWSWEGLRSWATTRQDVSYRRKYSNQSAEMTEVLKHETSWLLPLVSMVHVNNRLLITTVAEKTQCMERLPGSTEETMQWNDYAFKGIISLDFDQINNQIKSDNQTYVPQSASFDGIWTGIHPTQLVAVNLSGKTRAFAFDKSASGENRIFEILDSSSGIDNESMPIACSLFTRNYVGMTGDTYTEQPFVTKRLVEMRLWISSIKHPTVVELHVKNDLTTSYHLLQKRMLNFETWNKDLVDNDVFVGTTRNCGMVPFQDFEDNFSVITKRPYNFGHELGFLIRWFGHAEISRMLAKLNDEGPANNELKIDQIEYVNEPAIDPFEYRI
jgi:hypothetical protein